MGYGYQKDLDAAFKAKVQTNELPFPFGYHWRGGQGGSNPRHQGTQFKLVYDSCSS